METRQEKIGDEVMKIDKKKRAELTNGDVALILGYIRGAGNALGEREEEILRELGLSGERWHGVLERFARFVAGARD
jgi:hypothetical protein